MITQKEYLVTFMSYGEGRPLLHDNGRITIRSRNSYNFDKAVYENETTNSCSSLVEAACDIFKDILLKGEEGAHRK